MLRLLAIETQDVVLSYGWDTSTLFHFIYVTFIGRLKERGKKRKKREARYTQLGIHRERRFYPILPNHFMQLVQAKRKTVERCGFYCLIDNRLACVIQSSAQKSFQATYMLFSILLFNCCMGSVGYFIQCQQYRQCAQIRIIIIEQFHPLKYINNKKIFNLL